MFSTPFVLLFTVILSIPLLLLLAPKILPPKHLQISAPDEIDDLALFRRATLASSLPHQRRHRGAAVSRLSLGTNRRPKVAFLFLTNSDLHFAPLWGRFFEGHEALFNVYVHDDPSRRRTAVSGKSVFDGRFIASKRTERSSPTLISAVRRLIATALLDDPLNQHFALVSQNCIPLHSFQFTYNTLLSRPKISAESNSSRSVLSQFKEPASYIEILSGEPQMRDRYTARGENTMLPEVPFDRFRIGSQFFSLNRKHALVVVQDRRLWRKFKMPCRNPDSCYPEENYFPTLLSMEDPNGCSHYTLTRVNWTDSVGGHPRTYQAPEISADLIYGLRESNSSYSYLFARKFTPDCLDPLMEIADKVIFRD